MTFSAKHVLLGSAILLTGSPLFAAETSGNSNVAPAPRAYVNCPGISSVPMTSDAEQALPLRQSATLACGESVAVLADNEGYTVHIRTSEGKEGYVARMYLTNEAGPSQPNANASKADANASASNGVVRWQSGASGCDQFISNGRQVESATINGITVQVSLQDTGWKLRATIAVSNQGDSALDVLPSLISLDELKPELRNLREEDAAKLVRRGVNHQVLHTESNAHPSFSAVAFRSTSGPALNSVSYRTTAAPDIVGNLPDAASVQAMALKNTSLPPGQKTAGVLWFARDPNAHELSMRLSVGDVVFDFPFSFDQKK
jgi:hypothetical protein